MNIQKHKKVSVSVRMPAELYNALRIIAVSENRSLSGQIVQALEEWFDEKNGKNKTTYRGEERKPKRIESYFGSSPVGPSISPSPSPSPQIPEYREVDENVIERWRKKNA